MISIAPIFQDKKTIAKTMVFLSISSKHTIITHAVLIKKYGVCEMKNLLAKFKFV